MKHTYKRAGIAIIGLVGGLPSTAAIGANCQNPTPIWQDEFNGSALDTSKWEIMLGDGCSYGICGWGNNELQSYKAENLAVANGKLTITAKKERVKGSQYTSGRIRTANMPNGGEWTHGRFEASIKLPNGTGMWPAFWMLPTDPAVGWPVSGEIDILEATGQADMIAFGTIHYGQPYPDNEWTSGRIIKQPDRWSDGFHEYAVEWEPNEIRWYVDDILYSVKTPDDLSDPSFWTFENYSYHFLLNMAVGGSIGGVVDDSQLPQTMEVDYVRVYDFAQPSLSGPHIVDANTTASYRVIDKVGTNSSYSWTSPTGDISNSDILTVNWQEQGGVVSAAISNSCGQSTVEMNVHVLPVLSETTILDNFEGNGELTFSYWDGQYNEVPNPASDAVNNSPTVLEYVRNNATLYDVIAGNTMAIANAAELIAGSHAFYLDVYMPSPSAQEILVQLEDGSQATPDNYPTGRHSKYIAHTQPVAGWQRLKFTLEDRIDGGTRDTDVTEIVILIAPNSNDGSTYYLDNFSLYTPQSSPETNPTALVVTDVSTTLVSAGKGTKQAQATVTIVDDTGAPEMNAVVSGQFGGDWSETVSAATGENGVVTFETSTALSGNVSANFCVMDVNGSLPLDTAASQGMCQ
ncbi:family 16 glycosylhydrolase [Alteromonas sp. ASW11-130]|uniref:family 16 glycosylhydrolase n=1 Tax=Alteromonas sp. ASW11-130 TaxID=3015775 RepID=UPI0022426F8D|nr:family 16 glycosylhydrolase [Alteromonas sp. ASW11-130]MCW8090498.1 glycoside hydrolase family 16 protein [Alteromonas sp. ASW11-130]